MLLNLDNETMSQENMSLGFKTKLESLGFKTKLETS